VVHAPGEPDFELHTLGWRSFQDLCAAILREVWGQTVQPFADTRDAGAMALSTASGEAIQ
jgi:hypothetical protein